MARILTEFEKEAARSRYHSLNELRSKMDLSWLEKKDYRVITDESEFDAVFEEMHRYKLFGFDTETTGLNIFNLSRDNQMRDQLVGICMSWKGNQGIYLPFEHTRFKNLDKKYVLRKLGPFLESRNLVLHNGMYDGKVMYQEGILLNIVHDTRTLYFNIDSNVSRGSKGLKALSERMYGYPIIEFEDIFDTSSDYGLFRVLPEDLVKSYACADPDHTLQLFIDSFGFLTEGQRRSYALDMKLERELVRSEYYGKGVDMKLCKEFSGYNDENLERLSDAIYRYAHYLVCKKRNFDYSDSKYIFSISSSDELAHLFYNLLGYKVLKVHEDTGRPSVDKFVLKSMLREEEPGMDEFEENLLNTIEKSSLAKAGYDWLSDGDKILIDRKKFNTYKYKLPYLIQVWRKLEKDKTSFYAKLLDNNYEGKFFSDISQTSTQTARLTDFIQTLVGSLKHLIVPYNPDTQYFIDFDFAQIEYRVMAGLSGIDWLVERLKDPEADYHREGGSIIVGKAPEDITKSERSSLKSVNFGIPYGMSAKGIMENRYGIGLPPVEREKRLKEIQDLLSTWESKLYQIANMLNSYRDKAITPVDGRLLKVPLKGKKIGRIDNPLGRSRVFYLDKMDESDIASIRRQAGNYPIQSFAREIYSMAIVRLCAALKEHGLMDIKVPDETMPSGYRLENKVVIIAYIHDECLLNVDKDVSPNLIQKLIYDNCMIELKGHPNYYCGINVVTNWHEGKEDAYEAPVKYAKWVSENYDDLIKTYSPECCQRDFVFDQIKDYMTKRVAEEICKFVPDVFETKVLYLDRVVSRFKNYFVKPKISSFWPLWREVLDSSKQSPDMYKNDITKDLCKNAGFDYDDYTAVLLETYLLAVLGDLDVVYPNGYRKHYEQHGVSGKALSLVRESVSDREASLLQEQEDDITDDTASEVEPAESANTKILTEVFSAISKDMKNDDVLRLG